MQIVADLYFFKILEFCKRSILVVQYFFFCFSLYDLIFHVRPWHVSMPYTVRHCLKSLHNTVKHMNLPTVV